jgi:hypothetical protein
MKQNSRKNSMQNQCSLVSPTKINLYVVYIRTCTNLRFAFDLNICQVSPEINTPTGGFIVPRWRNARLQADYGNATLLQVFLFCLRDGKGKKKYCRQMHRPLSPKSSNNESLTEYACITAKRVTPRPARWLVQRIAVCTLCTLCI